jgi:TonB family protein
VPPAGTASNLVGQTKVRLRRHHERLRWVLVLSAVLSCSATQKTSSPRTPDSVSSHYPADARAQGIESDVVLALTVQPDGSISDIVVVESGGAEFDRAATDAMRTARFRPATTRDGVAVPSRIRWTYRFRIDSER